MILYEVCMREVPERREKPAPREAERPRIRIEIRHSGINDGRERNRRRRESCFRHRWRAKRLRRRGLGQNTNATELNRSAAPRGTSAKAPNSYAPADYRTAAVSNYELVDCRISAPSSCALAEQRTESAANNYVREECRSATVNSCAPAEYRTESAASSCARAGCRIAKAACTRDCLVNKTDGCCCSWVMRHVQFGLRHRCLGTRYRGPKADDLPVSPETIAKDLWERSNSCRTGQSPAAHGHDPKCCPELPKFERSSGRLQMADGSARDRADASNSLVR